MAMISFLDRKSLLLLHSRSSVSTREAAKGRLRDLDLNSHQKSEIELRFATLCSRSRQLHPTCNYFVSFVTTSSKNSQSRHL